MILPDVLASGLVLVFCGTAPSRRSKEVGAYYAHPGNLFWRALHETGLTPRRLKPEDYPELPLYGLGLTDLNKREWGADADLTPEGFDVAGFVAKIRRYRPAAVAFTSKTAARHCLGRSIVSYGRQAETIDGVPLFVLPSPSGRARGYFTIEPWQEAADFAREITGGGPA